jgi:hypothetical protein
MKSNNEMENMIKNIREKNPKIEYDSIFCYTDMKYYLKYTDLPDNYADLIRELWDIICYKSEYFEKCLSKRGQSIEAYNELIVGYSLYNYCKSHSLKLIYSPKIDNKTPDWVIEDDNQNIIIEVSTLNNSDWYNSFNICCGLIQRLVKNKLNKQGIIIELSYNFSQFSGYISKYQNNNRKDEYYDKLCNEIADRIVDKVHKGLSENEEYEDDSGIIIKKDIEITSYLSTSGLETPRVIDKIIDKCEKYKEISKSSSLIIALICNDWNGSKTYGPKLIADLIYNPQSVNDDKFYLLGDKEKHISKINNNKEILEKMEGLLFYGIPSLKLDSICYEFYQNPYRQTHWELSENFQRYLNSGKSIEFNYF